MRAIDADALTEVLEKMPAMGFKNIDNQTYTLVLLAQVFNIIEQQPTIEERKKGQWRNIQIGEWLGVECTACKIAYDRREVPHVNGGGVAWYFCPECGADMRGEGNGNE